MQYPVNLTRYIAVVTEKELDKDTVKCWFRCVRENAPSGTTLSIPNVDNEGNPRSVSLIHREGGGKHFYFVPLTRDLSEDEADVVVRAFAAENPDLDFDIEINAPMADRMDQVKASIELERDSYLALCDAWAKRQHEQWLKDRQEAGWSYGPVVSLKYKTHPLIQPWEQLPTKFKQLDFDHPKMLLDLLNDQGYAVITKGELESLLKLMRVLTGGEVK